MIGLNANLRAPKVELLCNCKPSLYAYPPPVTTGVCVCVHTVLSIVFTAHLSCLLGSRVHVEHSPWHHTRESLCTDQSQRVPFCCVHLCPPPIPVPAEATKEMTKVEKAVLSTTAKARERQKKKDAEKQSKGSGAGDSSSKPAGK